MPSGGHRSKPPGPLRVLYLAGSGNASRSLAALAEGHFNQDIGHVGYSDQLFRACLDVGAEVLAVCTNDKAEDASVGPIRLERRADLLAGQTGLSYHMANLRLAREVSALAARFRANVVITPFEPYPFLLEPLWRRGVRVVLALHCTMWAAFRPRGASWKVWSPLMRRALRRGITAVLSASNSITAQVQQVGGAGCCPVVEFLPTFRPEAFPVPSDPVRGKPFHVMFVGRCEEDKGVFMLLEVARRLRDGGRRDIVFDICGDGSALAPLKASVAQHGLEDLFLLHGWCMADRLRELSARAHAFVVPTTTQFNEGFNHVVIEGLLAGRPIVTSEVCPAVEYVGAPALLARPDDAGSYAETIVSLADDQSRYDEVRRLARPVSERFFDPSQGFGVGVRSILAAVANGEPPAPRIIDPSPTLSRPPEVTAPLLASR